MVLESHNLQFLKDHGEKLDIWVFYRKRAENFCRRNDSSADAENFSVNYFSAMKIFVLKVNVFINIILIDISYTTQEIPS